MNKKLIMISQASVMVLVNQGLATEEIVVNAKDVMTCTEDPENNKIILEGINMNAPQLAETEGKTIKLTVPGKIDGKQVEVAPKAFYNLDMNGASLQLTFKDGVKFPSDCSEMFANDDEEKSPITSIDFGKVDTKNVTNMESMFFGCDSLDSLDVSKFNTQHVTDMSSMFSECKSLNSLNVRNFNTQDVEDMGSMFYECEALKSLDLSSFNTENVTNMGSMFKGCTSLKSLNLSSFDTENVTNMYSMFSECKSLNSLNVSNFNTQNVKSMKSMFEWCKALKSLDLSNFNTENVKNMENMFWECKALKSLDLSNFNTENVKDMADMFFKCNNLKSLMMVDTNSFNKNILKQVPKNADIIDIAKLLQDKRNELNQMYYRASIYKKIYDPELNDEYKWIQDTEKYGESIKKIIGEAIVDCMEGKNEFKGKGKAEDVITFGVESIEDLQKLEQKHWNAIILYNYIHLYKYYLAEPAEEDIDNDGIFDHVYDNVFEHYKDIYRESYKDNTILDEKLAKLEQNINQSISDIKKYDAALGFSSIMYNIFYTADRYSENLSEENNTYREFLCPKFSCDSNKGGTIDQSIWISGQYEHRSYDYGYKPKLFWDWENSKFTFSFSASRCPQGQYTAENVELDDYMPKHKEILKDLFGTLIEIN